MKTKSNMAKINCKTWRDASNDLEGYLSSSWISADNHKLSNNKCVGGRIWDGAVVCGASLTACAGIISFLGETSLQKRNKSDQGCNYYLPYQLPLVSSAAHLA